MIRAREEALAFHNSMHTPAPVVHAFFFIAQLHVLGTKQGTFLLQENPPISFGADLRGEICDLLFVDPSCWHIRMRR